MSNIYSINGIEYDFECTIKNKDGEAKFNKYAIKRMNIVDTLFDPFLTGDITFANSYDLLEQDFLIRGDGSDTITIKFKPQNDKNADVFEHTFILNLDLNSGNTDTRADNYKTFLLLDEHIAMFNNNIPYNKRYSGNVGDIMKQIFIEVLGEDKVDLENWEPCDFRLSYTPPNTFRYWDLIKYLMPFLCSKEENLFVKCFLKYDEINKKFYLKKISDLFNENDKRVTEAFIISDVGGDTETINPNNPPSGPEFAAYLNQLKNFQVSTPLYNWNNDYFLSYLVYGYDPMLGRFKISKIDFENIKQEWEKLFVDVFSLIGGKPKPFLPNNESITSKYKKIKMAYPLEESIKAIISEICNTLIFYNLQCSFQILGSGARKAGGFVDVVKTGKEIIKSDEKSFGRWFVTSVSHEFFGETYKNTILGCKTYVGPQSKI
jgi:hypothetical protein